MSDSSSSDSSSSDNESTAVVATNIEPTVSASDFVAMQEQLSKAQDQLTLMETEKIDIQKAGVLANLKTINPKLAELNKDAELSTLKAVLNSVKKFIILSSILSPTTCSIPSPSKVFVEILCITASNSDGLVTAKAVLVNNSFAAL